MFILVLVLALQLQVRQTNKRLDEFLKRMSGFMADVSEYASQRNEPDWECHETHTKAVTMIKRQALRAQPEWQ